MVDSLLVYSFSGTMVFNDTLSQRELQASDCTVLRSSLNFLLYATYTPVKGVSGFYLFAQSIHFPISSEI